MNLIPNRGPANLQTVITHASKPATKADLAVAFVTRRAVVRIRHNLQRIANRGPVRVLTGLFQGFTEPAALQLLMKARKATRGRLMINLSREPTFHRKQYVLYTRSKVLFIIGSSNLTDQGLHSGGECNAAVEMPANSVAARRISEDFDGAWKDSLPVDSKILVEYSRVRPTPRRALQTSIQLAKILGRRRPRQPQPVSNNDISYWRDYVDTDLPRATIQIVDELTDWDRRGYSYFAVARDKYRKGDRLLMLDFSSSYASLATIRDVVSIPVATADGRHFAAYTEDRHRKLGKVLWRALRAQHIISSRANAKRPQKISSAKWQNLRSIFKRK